MSELSNSTWPCPIFDWHLCSRAILDECCHKDLKLKLLPANCTLTKWTLENAPVQSGPKSASGLRNSIHVRIDPELLKISA
jgi:hypothetical protein